MSDIHVGSSPGSSSSGPTGGSSTPSMPWNPNGNTPSVNINWNLPPAALLKEIEQQFQSLITWLQANPGNAYNGGLALLQLTLQCGQHMGQLGPYAAQLTAFFNNQMTSGGGDSTLMSMIVMMAAQGEAVQNGQTAADAWIAQLTAELKGMTGFGSIFSSMYSTASYYSGGGLDTWISQNYVTLPNPDGQGNGPAGSGKVWINPLTGLPYTNFTDFANALAMPVGNLVASANATKYINNLYQTEIEQIFAGTKNPWERMMQLLALVSERMNDQGQQMNGLSGNLNTLSEANTDVADMQNDLKTPTPASMQAFYKSFANLKSLIDENPSLDSLKSDLDAVEGIFNGNTVSSNSTVITSTNNFGFNQTDQIVEFTPTGSTTPIFLEWTGPTGGIYAFSTRPTPGQTSGALWHNTGINVYSASWGSKEPNMGDGTGTITSALSWNVSAGNYTLPPNVVVEFTANGKTIYMEWINGKIETSSTPDMQNPTTISSNNGLISLPDGTLGILTTLNYGQLQGLGDYQDIATAVSTAQTDYANTTASNNANVLSSLQTYFNSIAQPTQQEYQTDSSSYSTEMSAFAQFLQAPITQEQTMTTASASANS